MASKSGLIMVLLGVIFMNGNRATEKEIWEFLSMLGIYVGRRHWIFGEPRRLITKDLVQKKYLMYQQVPNVILHTTSSCGAQEVVLRPIR